MQASRLALHTGERSVDATWEQESAWVWKMLKNASKSHQTGAHGVGRFSCDKCLYDLFLTVYTELSTRPIGFVQQKKKHI